MLLADIGIKPNGLTGDAKLEFNNYGATLGEAGAMVESAGLGNCGCYSIILANRLALVR